MSELRRIMEYGLCHEEVSRKGQSQPCEKAAVAVRLDPEDRSPYPVCAFHSRSEMVSLNDLLAGIEVSS